MAVIVGNWRFYTDASTDGAMTPLAAVNTVPTLTGAQTMGGIIRLRVQLVGDSSGGSVSLVAQHGVDGNNWKAWGSQSETGGNQWVRWANGSATAGATVGSLLLAGSTASGKYHESTAVSETVGANQTVECDITLRNMWYPPSTVVRTRLLNSSSALAYSNGIPNIGVLSCTASQRAHTIDIAGTSASGGQSREVDFSAWPRMVHDGTYWWWIGTQPNVSGTSLQTWRWDGTGGDYANWVKSSYSVGQTIVTSTEGDVRHAPNFGKIGNNTIAQVALRPTSGNMRYLRGTFAGGSITWTNTDLGRSSYSSSGYPIHCAIDDGGYHWVGGFNGTSGMWAARTQTSDNGGSYTPDFGALDSRRKTIADSVTAAEDGTPCALMGLTSDKALMLWVNGSSLRWATVSDGAGFSTPATLGSTLLKSSHDWGLSRSLDGAYVYLVYRDQTNISGDAGGDWVFWVYNVSTGTWTKGPNAPRGAQNNNKDGIVVSVSADKVYAFGTGVGPGGNQDRPVQVCVYEGSGTSGSWQPSHTFVSPVQRGNGDDIAGARQVGSDGLIPVGYLWGDNDVNGHPFTFEYYTVQAATPTAATTYYVSVSGSDSADGTTPGTAWRTITKVNATSLNPGDSVLFQRGSVFTGTRLTITSSGTGGNPITVGAYGTGAAPIIDGGGTDSTRGTTQPIEIRGNWIIVDGLSARHSLYAGIDVFGDDVTIKNCEIRNNPVGIEQDETAARTIVTDCTLTDNNIVLVGPGSDDDSGAMAVLLHGTDAEVTRCTISGHRGASPDYGSDGAAIEIYGATGAVIHHNLATDNRCFTELGHVNSANITYHHNVVWSTVAGDKGVVIQGTGTFGPVLGTVLHHNTIVLTGGSGSATGTQGVVVGTGSDANIRNNIVVATWKPGYSGGVVEENHNVWYGLGGVGIQHQIKSQNDSTGQDSYGDQSIVGNPEFVDISTGDLHLTGASPAVNTGAVGLGYSADYEGVAFVGTPDMGAYEFTGSVTIPPATPTGLTATASSASSVTVAWNASSGAASYDIERNGTVVTGVSSPYADTGRSGSTMYSYRVRAVNAAGTSAWSNVVAVTTPEAVPVTEITRRSTSSTENTTAVTSHSVAKPAGASVGDVLIVSVVLNGSSITTIPAGWETLFTASGSLTNPKNYAYMRVLTEEDDAVTSYTWISNVAVASSIGCDCLIGVDPINPLDTNVSSIVSSTSTATLAIPSVTTITDGSMLVTAYAINSSNISRILTQPTGFAKVWDLAGKRQAYATKLQISAGSIGDQSWSVDTAYASAAWLAALRPAVLNASPPAVPADLSIAATGATAATITWGSVSGATSYDLERNGVVLTDITSPYNDSGLTASTLYSYRVRAVNSSGPSAWSAAATVTTPAVSSGVVIDYFDGTNLIRQKIQSFDGVTLIDQNIN